MLSGDIQAFNQAVVMFNCSLFSIIFGMIDPWFFGGFAMAVIAGTLLLLYDIRKDRMLCIQAGK